MISVKGLTKRYGAFTAVKDLNFTVEQGKIYGFLGPNGAGKSTTMNIITGCLAASEGEVTVNGYDILAEPRQAKSCIGYLPEQPPLYPELTPDEYLRFVGRAKGLKGEELEQQVTFVTEQTGLSQVCGRLIRQLSKCYRQRVGIAQAMLGEPEVIILDEPTVGLDPKQIIEIRALIRSLAPAHTVIISSHILSEISEICDHVIIIDHGELVADDTMYRLRHIFSETTSVFLTAKGDLQRIRMILNETEGISSYTLDRSLEGEEGLYDAVIETEAGADIRQQLFEAFAADHIPLLRLSTDALSLEDVYLKLTAEDDSAAAAIRDTVLRYRQKAAAAQLSETLEEENAEKVQQSAPIANQAAEPTVEPVAEEAAASAANEAPKKKKSKKGEDDDYTPLFS